MNKSESVEVKMWMIDKLNLKGNELILFALINGRAKEKGRFLTTAGYLSSWLKVSRGGVYDIIKRLVKKNLIVKSDDVDVGDVVSGGVYDDDELAKLLHGHVFNLSVNVDEVKKFIKHDQGSEDNVAKVGDVKNDHDADGDDDISNMKKVSFENVDDGVDKEEERTKEEEINNNIKNNINNLNNNILNNTGTINPEEKEEGKEEDKKKEIYKERRTGEEKEEGKEEGTGVNVELSSDEQLIKESLGDSDLMYVDCVEEWMAYKRARGEMLGKISEVKMLIKNLKEMSNYDPKIAEEIVSISMQNMWKGVHIPNDMIKPRKPGDVDISDDDVISVKSRHKKMKELWEKLRYEPDNQFYKTLLERVSRCEEEAEHYDELRFKYGLKPNKND